MREKRTSSFPIEVSKVLEDINKKISTVRLESSASANTMKDAVKRMISSRHGLAIDSPRTMQDAVTSLVRQSKASAGASARAALTPASVVASGLSGAASATELSGQERGSLSDKVGRLESKMDGIIAALAAQSELLRSLASAGPEEDEDSY